MIFSDSGSDVYGVIWDGDTNTWDNEQTLETSTTTNARECIAVEYIASGSGAGEAMFTWGYSTNFQSRIWNGSSWDSELTQIYVGGTPYWFTLKADPNSNRLALATVDSGRDLNVFIWSGSAWSASSPWKYELATNLYTYGSVRILSSKPRRVMKAIFWLFIPFHHHLHTFAMPMQTGPAVPIAGIEPVPVT